MKDRTQKSEVRSRESAVSGQPLAVGSRLSLWISGFRSRQRERGIALVIVLGVLTVILIIAVAFALSARTEAKSGASFDTLVQSKSFAKMGVDRCLMEMVYVGNSSSPYSGKPGVYQSTDLTTNVDGTATNDATGEFSGVAADFVDVNLDGVREAGEPYWIGVTNAQGKLIGRFAYAKVGATSGSSSGSGTTLVDVNADGNIMGSGDTYVRSNGFVGVATNVSLSGYTNKYTRGIAGDVNLSAFLQQLGFSAPDTAAQRILQYRYGWDGSGTPSTGVYGPGDKSIEDNGVNVTDDPAEYDPVDRKGGNAGSKDTDRAISDLNQISGLLPAADAATSNLATYATISSSDNNLQNQYSVSRPNLNSTKTGSTSDVVSVVAILQKALPTNDLNQLTQWAVNLIDWHTTNYYPTIVTNAGLGATNTFIGVKRCPYLNQIRNADVYNAISIVGANAQLKWTGYNAVELWNPYGSVASSNCTVWVTNSYSWNIVNAGVNSGAPLTISTQVTYSVSLPPVLTPPAGNSMSGSYPWNYSQVNNLGCPLFSTNYLLSPGATITISNTVKYTVTGVTTANIIHRGAGTLSSWTLSNVLTNWGGINAVYLNGEADDPRIGYLWPQTNDVNVGANYYYGLGYTNYVVATNSPNFSPREGTNSFYIRMGNYTNIGEIGYVYRGEPLQGSNAVGAWQTLRLQPGGEGGILDYIRVSDLSEVRGRINLNSDTNGPLGSYSSPAFWALFKGISVPGYSTLGDTQVSNIVVSIANYRAALSNALNPSALFTNIGQICDITNLFTTDSTLGGAWISSTNDYAREYVVRSIADLITTRPESGSEIVAWGQTIKGNKVVGTIQIRAWYTKDNNRIKLTKFQYVKQQ